jgi:hypothetical protein
MGTPAFAQAFQQFRLPAEDLIVAVKWTFNGLGWPFEPIDASCFEVKVPLSIWGRGEETLYVAVEADGWVLAESECDWRTGARMDTTPADRNQRNLETFFNRLNQLIILEALGRMPGFRQEDVSWARISTHVQERKRRAASR